MNISTEGRFALWPCRRPSPRSFHWWRHIITHIITIIIIIIARPPRRPTRSTTLTQPSRRTRPDDGSPRRVLVQAARVTRNWRCLGGVSKTSRVLERSGKPDASSLMPPATGTKTTP